jgi:hypothetical protein
MGLSRPRVANLERIARKAQPLWLSWVGQGKLKHKHLEAVLSLPQDKAEDLLRKAIAGRWPAHRLREEVQVAKGARRPDDAHPNADVAYLEAALTELLATKVAINTKPNGGGELVIAFTDVDTLEGLLERVGYRAD